MPSKRKKCNFCNWAQVTAKTHRNRELKCTKRKEIVYTDDSCDLFEDMCCSCAKRRKKW